MNTSTRALTPVERRMLGCAVAHWRRFLGGMPRKILLVGVAIFAGGCALSLSFGGDEWIGNWRAFVPTWAGLAIVVALWSYWDDAKPIRRAIRLCDETLARNEIKATHIRSSSMVELEEIEDEGACYAFQFAEGRIVFVTGQEFYASARFPNDDFSLAVVRDREGHIAMEWIVKYGRKLTPVRTIPAKARARLILPGHLQVIDGRLEDLERLLEAAPER
jgi:hypothetical protein